MEDKIISIKDEFIKNSTPGVGRVSFDINLNVKRHINEINIALWLKDTFGGNIKVLKENKTLYKFKSPDFMWIHVYWELKNCSSLRSVDTRLHKAIKQIKSKDNKGGIILIINNNINPKYELLKTIYNRLYITKDMQLTIIIVLNGELVDIFKLKEKC